MTVYGQIANALTATPIYNGTVSVHELGYSTPVGMLIAAPVGILIATIIGMLIATPVGMLIAAPVDLLLE